MAEHKVQAFWKVRGHGSQELSEFLGPWNGISYIFKANLPDSDLAVPQEPT